MTGRGKARSKPVKRKYDFSENTRRKLYLLDRPLDNLPQLQLPTVGHVLRYLQNLKTNRSEKFKPDSFHAGCTQLTGSNELECAGGKCDNRIKRCCTGAVIDLWEKAGFGGSLRISGKAVKKKIIELQKKYANLLKLGTSAYVLKDKKFKEKLSAKEEEYIDASKNLFDISARDFEKQLESDRLRSATARKYDMLFFNDQKGKRIGIMDENCPDLEFAEAHRSKKMREEKEKERKEKEATISDNNHKLNVSFNEPELELSFDDGSDYDVNTSEDSCDSVDQRSHKKHDTRPKVKIKN